MPTPFAIAGARVSFQVTILLALICVGIPAMWVLMLFDTPAQRPVVGAIPPPGWTITDDLTHDARQQNVHTYILTEPTHRKSWLVVGWGRGCAVTPLPEIDQRSIEPGK